MKIAIIGNGPISNYQRKIINSYDIIVRFNGTKNLKKNDKTTVLAIRQNETGFFGLNSNCVQPHVSPKHMILLGTNRINHMKKVCLKRNINTKTIHIYYDKYFYPNFNKYYTNKFRNDSFSSGFIIINYFLHHFRDHDIHIFGMNWNLPTGFHHMKFERKEIDTLQKQFKIKIYKTPSPNYLP